ADQVVVGIGSSNRYDAHNPFTSAETRDMLRLALAGHDNWQVVEVPDLGDGPRWAAMVGDQLGPLDMVVTANGYVRQLLLERYAVIHPVHLVEPSQRSPVNGTMVRQAMARGEPWRHLVPETVAAYLDRGGLVERLVREFGAELR